MCAIINQLGTILIISDIRVLAREDVVAARVESGVIVFCLIIDNNLINDNSLILSISKQLIIL